jgi:hypothetical protein
LHHCGNNCVSSIVNHFIGHVAQSFDILTMKPFPVVPI